MKSARANIVCFLAFGVLAYVTIMASTSCLGEKDWAPVSTQEAVATRGTAQRTNIDSQQVPTPADPQTRPIEPETPKKEERSVLAKAEETGETPSPQVGCQCEDCQCPDEMICKNGHCMQKYAIVFTTSGCVPCIRMHPVIHSLRKQGYPVYYFKNYTDVAQRYNVRLYPTTIIFDNGREVQRFQGVVSERLLKSYL